MTGGLDLGLEDHPTECKGLRTMVCLVSPLRIRLCSPFKIAIRGFEMGVPEDLHPLTEMIFQGGMFQCLHRNGSKCTSTMG